VHDFALHLTRIDFGAPFSPAVHAPLWLAVSGASVEDCLEGGGVLGERLNLPKDPAVLKLLLLAGAHLPSGVSATAWETEDEGTPRSGSVERDCDSLRSDGRSNSGPRGGGGGGLNKGVAALRNGSTMVDDSESTSYRDESNRSVVVEHKALLLPGGLPSDTVDAVDKSGQTALSRAARSGDYESVCALLRAGASVNHADTDGWTVLRSAAWGGHASIVRALLDAGVIVDQSDEDGRTALRAAAWGGHDEIVLLLLDRGAGVNKVITVTVIYISVILMICRFVHGNAF